jgi:NTE family protein
VTTRALVLGGGGVTGVAWEIGLLAGLAARGVQLGGADLIVGTSAGSVVGAQLACGTNLDQMYAGQLEPPEERPPGSADVARLRLRHIALYAWAALRHRDPVQARARIGRLATTARTMPEAERRAVIAARVPGDDWPARQLLITAVDAGSGEFRAFEAGQGVGLIDAVAASCAVPGGVAAGDHRRAAVDGRWHALPGQRRPGRRVRRRRGARAGHPGAARQQRAQSGGRAAAAGPRGRRGVAGPGRQGRDRP